MAKSETSQQSEFADGHTRARHTWRRLELDLSRLTHDILIPQSDKTLLFERRSIGQLTSYVNGKRGTKYGFLGLWYGGTGSEWLAKVRIASVRAVMSEGIAFNWLNPGKQIP